MSNANPVRNNALLDLLKAAEKSQGDRLQRQLKNPVNRLDGARPRPAPSTPAKVQQSADAQEEELSAVKTKAPAVEADVARTEIVPLTLDEVEWLEEVVERHGHGGFSRAISRLVEQANTEPPEAKKKLFLVIRCRRCSVGAKGGVKHDHSIELPASQWTWLNNVRERCRHASVGKTLRIIVDFYMPLCKEDSAFEQTVLRAGFANKTGRHADAVGNVDPARALGIKGVHPRDRDLAKQAALGSA